jgi:hypothetical protein
MKHGMTLQSNIDESYVIMVNILFDITERASCSTIVPCAHFRGQI